MKNYEDILEKSGMSATRIPEIAEAINLLHKALSKCDYSNRRIFFNQSITEHLQGFAKGTGMADVTDCGVVRKTTDKKRCYYATFVGKPRPVIVIENEPSYREIDFTVNVRNEMKAFDAQDALTPDKNSDVSWEAVEKWCDAANMKLGLSVKDAGEIVNSSMAESNRQAEIDKKGHYASVSDVGKFYVKKFADCNGFYAVRDKKETSVSSLNTNVLYRAGSVNEVIEGVRNLDKELKKTNGHER